MATRWFVMGCFSLLVLIGGLASAEEIRTWTDSTGKFKIEAKFVAESGGKVTLENAAGKRFEIPLEKLSSADQKVVADLNTTRENPFAPVEANPFQQQAGTGAAPTVDIDWSNVPELNPAPVSREWNPNLGGIAAPVDEVAYRPIPTPKKTDFFEKFKGIELNEAAERALIGYVHEDRREKTLKHRFLLADLKLGKLLTYNVDDLEHTMAPLALSDDGVTALMRRNDFGFGKSNILEVWRFSGDGIKRELSWEPHADANGGNKDIKWGAFLDKEKAVTVSDGGKVVLWNIKSAQPLWQFAIKGGCVPGLSRDRKYLAFVREKDIGILDLQAGEVLVARSLGDTAWPSLRISPNGNRLACIDHSRLRVFDGATGDLILDTPKREFPSGGFYFVDDNHLLVGDKILFNIPNQLKAWTYDGLGASVPYGNRVLLFSGGGPGLLMVESLPQTSVIEAMTAALKQPDFWALQEGTTVNIKVDEITDAAERERVKKSLTEKAEAMGFKVGENGTIDLIASVEESDKKKEVKYGRGFSPFGPGTIYKVKEFKSRLRFEVAGQVAWEQGANNIPGMLNLRDGQSVEKALKEHEKPNYAWFDRVELPKVLPKPSAKNTLGTTKVTSAGLR